MNDMDNKGVSCLAEVNWQEIKTEYITTDTSQRKLAVKYGIPLSNIERRSADEGWVALRKEYKGKVTAKTIEKIANKDAGKLARLMDTTTKAIDVAVKAFEDDRQFNRYLIERREKYAVPEISEDGEQAILEKQWTEEKIYSKLDTRALKDLTSVLKDLTGLMRDFYNIPTPAQAEAQRIAAERLEMDRKKAELNDNNTNEIEIILEGGGPEAWNE